MDEDELPSDSSEPVHEQVVEDVEVVVVDSGSLSLAPAWSSDIFNSDGVREPSVVEVGRTSIDEDSLVLDVDDVSGGGGGGGGGELVWMSSLQ